MPDTNELLKGLKTKVTDHVHWLSLVIDKDDFATGRLSAFKEVLTDIKKVLDGESVYGIEDQEENEELEGKSAAIRP